MKVYILSTFALFVLLQSCVKPIPVTIPQMKEGLAINSQIIPNQIIIVSVTRTFTSLYKQGTTDSSYSNPITFDLFVPHALVTVKHNNIVDTLQQIADGIYGSTNTVLVNADDYVLNVFDSTTKQAISATTRMMPPAQVDAILPSKKIIGKDTTINIKCVVNDNANENNFYFVSISKTNSATGGIPLPGGIQNIFNKSSNIYLFTDDEMDNGKIVNEISFSSSSAIKKTDTVLIMVANIEEKYYKYLTAFNKTSSIITQLTGEPINLPSNITNGYGYFSAHFPVIEIKDLGKY